MHYPFEDAMSDLNANVNGQTQIDNGMERVLVVAEDTAVRSRLRRTLDALRFDVGEASGKDNALTRLRMVDYDAILMECLLFEEENLEVCRQLRDFYPRLPILIIGAHSSEDHKIAAFEVGVDDFMDRPVPERELAARLRSAVRRFRAPAVGRTRRFIAGEIVLDSTKHRVDKSGLEISLTPIEFRLLELLIQQPGQAVPHSVLATNLWGQETEAHRKHLRVIIRGLRGKIEDDPSQPEYLITHSYFGYSLCTPGSSK
jgi:two-component system, OmpR family, KDP operon response regulator KdpE